MNPKLRNFVGLFLHNGSFVGQATRAFARVVRRRRNIDARLTNTVMLHAGRCGSSVVADLLNQHPDMRWANEPFESMRPYYYQMDSDKRGYCRLADSIYLSGHANYGFDSKYLPEQHLREELANKSPEEYVKLLDTLGITHYILLNRKNHLKRSISIAIGQQTKQWASFAEPTENKAIYLDPNNIISYGRSMTLLQFFESLDAGYNNMKACIADRPLLELTYEDDVLQDPRKAYDKSAEFIGLSRDFEVNVRLKKQNARPMSELISNYDEIHKLLINTPYAWMLTAD